MTTRQKKTPAVQGEVFLTETPHSEVVQTAPTPVGVPLAATADEQLAGQIAMATAEDRLKAEIEAGRRAVAEAEARARAAE